MVWLGATLGLRWSEVAALRVGRLDLATGQLSVAEALVRGTGGRNVFGPPKSKVGRRTMFVPDVLTAMLATHLQREELREDEPDALVFTDDDRGTLRDSNWRRRVWEPATDAAACAGAGLHVDLRRLNATTLVEGIDVKTAQTRLGHADPRVTLAIYASAPASVDRPAADAIGERFFGADGKRVDSDQKRSRKDGRKPKLASPNCSKPKDTKPNSPDAQMPSCPVAQIPREVPRQAPLVRSANDPPGCSRP